MGVLLLQAEKFRLLRKVNTYTLKQTRISDRRDRLAKLIEKKEKFFSKKTSLINTRATALKSSLTSALNMGNLSALSSIFGNMGGLMLGGAVADLSIYYEQVSSGWAKGTDNNWTKSGTDQTKTDMQMWSDASALQSTINQQINALKGQLQTRIDQYIEIWKQQEEQMIEDECELAKEPLNQEDTELEIEQNTNDTLLELAQSRLDSINQKLPERVKDSAPKFGLS